MEKITITKITRTERTSARTNKPFTSLGLKAQEYGDQWLSGFGNKDNAGWKEGDQVEIEIKKVEKDGKTYLNFETPKAADKTDEKLEQVLNKIVGLTIEVRALGAKLDSAIKGAPDDGYLSNEFPDEPFPEDEGV